jgi:UDP-N-acetyl-2-amino-2-deoxyglucuronate dehydrogenase
MNIGIHFFDLLLWLFGPVQESAVHLRTPARLSGVLELEWARVKWFLSVDVDDLPDEWLASGKHAYRALVLGDEEFDFSTGFDDLHTRVYEDVMAGNGFGVEDARSSIELVHQIRVAELSARDGRAHPLAR